MADFAGVFARDPEVRRRYLETLLPSITSFGKVQTGRLDEGLFSALWAAPEGFPVAVEAVPEGKQITFGAGSHFIQACFSDSRIRINSDRLAFLPLYFCETDSVFSFATAPYLLSDAPGYHREIDPVALATLLMVGGIPGGRTLLQGLRRVRLFTEVTWSFGQSPARAAVVRPLIATDRYFGDSFTQNLERADAALAQAVDRSVAGSADTVFLLSGGLDSRLLAGYVARLPDLRLQAWTQGRGSDAEVLTALRVSKEFGWEHTIVPENPGGYEEIADLKISHEYMVAGFNPTYFPQLAALLSGRTALSGAYGDSVIGCPELDSNESSGYDADSHLGECSHAYFPPEVLRKAAVSAQLRDAVSVAYEELKNTYEQFPGSPFQKAWQFDYLALDCTKVVFPRYLAFGGRPAVPFADPEVFEAVAGMPAAHLGKRRMERELLIRRFPRLAALPVDRNRRPPIPVFSAGRLLFAQGIGWPQKIRGLQDHLAAHGRAPWGRRGGSEEKRFYYRMLDVNGQPWKRLRARAQKGQSVLSEWIDKKTLEKCLPDPAASMGLRDGIYHGQKTRLLTGLALWAERVLR